MSTPKMLNIDESAGIARLRLEKSLYPLDVVYGAAYVLIDRAYVRLDKDNKGRVIVEIQSKDNPSADGLNALAGEFSNELLTQALRRKLTMQNKAELEAIVTQAIAGASGALLPGLMDDDDLDFLDDPLGIAVPWEEKFSKEARKKQKEGEKE